MRITRWLTSSLVSVVAVAAVAGCGNSSDDTAGNGTKQGQQRTVGLFLPQGNPTGAAMIDAAKTWATSHGAKVTVFDVGVDPQKQYAQIQDAIAARSVDGMAFVPLNGPALAPLVKQAENAGIASVAASIPLADDVTGDGPVPAGLAGQAWQPSVRIGTLLADQVRQACEGVSGTCTAAYLSPGPQFPSEVAVIDTVKSELKQESSIDFVGALNGGLTRGSAVSATQDLLQAHPDIDVIAGSDQLVFGAEVALKKAGQSFGTGPSDIRLVGTSGTTDGIEQVTAGRWASTKLALPKTETAAALDLLDEAMRGTGAKPRNIDVAEESDIPSILTKKAIEESGFTGQY